MSTYRPSRPRRRLLSILLFATLLVSLAMPALAARLSSPKSQEGAPPAALATEDVAASTLPTVKAVESAKGAAPEGDPKAPNDVGSITNYAFSASSGTFTPLSGATVVSGFNADAVSVNGLPIGFTFYYMGVPYTTVAASSNGFLSFATLSSSSLTNALSAGPPRLVLAPLWDDLDGASAGQGSYLTTGSPGSRVFTFQWLNWEWNYLANAAVISFQAKLYEADGHIEFVYRQDAAAVSSGSASIGIAATATGSGSFLSLNGTGASPTVSSTSETTSLSTKPATGQVYAFTPPAAPAAPSGLNFTVVTQTGMTLNWNDNSSTESGFLILRSSDGVNYTTIATTAANANSYPTTGLLPGFTYYWQVFAFSEGFAPVGPASGTQATNPAGEITCNGAGGNWSATATWFGGVLPTATDNVTIADGCTVTIDTTATINKLTVGQGTSGVLQFEPTTARTLTVNSSVTIAAGGTLQSAASGTATTHLLSVGTDLTNNSTLDFSTNANTAGAELRFVNATNNTLSGAGATTDLRTLSISKGSGTVTTSSPVLEITISFTVRGAASDTNGFLSVSPYNGILKISGTFTYSSVVFTTAGYSIPSTAGFWLNNANFAVSGTNGSPTMNGLLRLTQGAYNVGTASGNAMGAGAGAIFLIEGGTLNLAGRLNTANAVSYTQSGGTVNVCTVANTTASTASFGLTSTSSVITMSGGVINLVQINSNATATSRLDYQVAGAANITGGTLNVGTSATTGNTGNFDFRYERPGPCAGD
jgi:hypothetical protein